MTQHAEWAGLQPCDLVMKGGITSGIVYPQAVVELSKRYRFCSIGGTSAGAIAAAGAAAAEHGRQAGGGAFPRLQEVSRWLADDQHLLGLFQPSLGAKPLFDVSLALVTAAGAEAGLGSLGAWLNFLSTLVASTAPGVAVGAGLPLLYGQIAGQAGPPRPGLHWGAPWLVGRALQGLTGGALQLAGILFWYLPAKNFYGMCTGHTEGVRGVAGEQPTNLTDWLSATLNDLAFGRPHGRPLTFGDLAARDVELKMVTTSLGHEQPYVLPFERHRLLFNVAEMARLFPQNVVDQLGRRDMVAAGDGLPAMQVGEPLRGRYYFLPEANDLPVVFGARLSLSFPILLSAVPLYSVSMQALRDPGAAGQVVITSEEEHLQRNWFTDGGISSNFPVHFFDHWLPPHPTFGINLTKMPSDAFETIDAGERRVRPKFHTATSGAGGPTTAESGNTPAVYLPPADAEPAPSWYPLGGVLSLIGAIWNTAQNFRDNMQTTLPSYRERVVQIRLADTEGGLNLNMQRRQVEALIQRGQAAGQELSEKFNFDHHRWVRTLVLMERLEVQLRQTLDSLRDTTPSYADLVQAATSTDFPYGLDNPARVAPVLKRIELLQKFAQEWAALDAADGLPPDTGFFGDLAPRSDSTLRVTPQV